MSRQHHPVTGLFYLSNWRGKKFKEVLNMTEWGSGGYSLVAG